MEAIELQKQMIRELVAEALGIDLNQPMYTQRQRSTAGYAADISALPVDISALAPQQDEDGNFYFMAGYSAVGATHDPIAPLP